MWKQVEWQSQALLLRLGLSLGRGLFHTEDLGGRGSRSTEGRLRQEIARTRWYPPPLSPLP